MTPDTPDDATAPKPGELWRHYKGGLYEVLMLATNEADKVSVVVYRLHDGTGDTWVRPVTSWLSTVGDGRRFTYEAAPAPKPVAERLFDASREWTAARDRADSELMKAAGIDPEAPETWPFKDVTFDAYDESFEFKEVTPGWLPTDDALRKWRDLGFACCWICHAGGGEKYYHLATIDAAAAPATGEGAK